MTFDYKKTEVEFTALRPQGGFRVIMADPAWEFETHSEKGQGKSPSQHYDTMSVEEVCSMPVELLAAADCALFLWITWPLMPAWDQVIRAWGFRFAGLAWEWIKFNPETGKYAFGGGYGTRKNLEPCLLATRGNPGLRKDIAGGLFGGHEIPEGVHSVRDFMEVMPLNTIREPRREHSRKPDGQYARIETMFEGPYVELFGRQRHRGWSIWGNEADKFEECA